VLALIDPQLYQTQVDRAEAQVEQAEGQVESAQAQVGQAEANLQRAIADLGQMQAKLVQAERDWNRVQQLIVGRTITDAERDIAQANAQVAKATLAVGEATVVQARAALKDAHAGVTKARGASKDAQAALENARINLRYCTIKSPVKGVIIDRRVNIGQTVVSSLNAPSLFLIAKDLKRLQVWASVNEADIGSIFTGQSVGFTVDAYPDRVFKGEVAQVRLNASMTQNVVTYTVLVNTDNTDGKLLPYLTANLRFEVSKRSQVLLVPNAALRWSPNQQLVAPDIRSDYIEAQRRKQGSPGDGPATSADKEPHDQGILWVQDGKFVRPVRVRVGPTDGLHTEIPSDTIRAGDAVVIGESRPGDDGTRNPFAPKLFGK
jgi:HlyD family secretion protein